MYLLDSEKKEIIPVNRVFVARTYGKKGYSYALTAILYKAGADMTTLGYYATEQQAQAELIKIYNALAAGEHIYAVSSQSAE